MQLVEYAIYDVSVTARLPLPPPDPVPDTTVDGFPVERAGFVGPGAYEVDTLTSIQILDARPETPTVTFTVPSFNPGQDPTVVYRAVPQLDGRLYFGPLPLGTHVYDAPPPGGVIASISDPTPVNEGANGSLTPIQFNLTLSGPAPSSLTLVVQLQADDPLKYKNAVQGVDWIGPAQNPLQETVTIPKGQTQGSFVVNAIGDNLIEPDEVLTAKIVGVSDPTVSISLTQGSAKATILNDDGSPETNVTISGLAPLDPDLANLVRQDVQAAIGRVEQSLGAALPHLEIAVQFPTTASIEGAAAAAEPVYSRALVVPGSPDIQIPNALYEKLFPQSGDPNGTGPDMILYLNSNTAKSFYTGLSSSAFSFDATTIFTHEILHGLGFSSIGGPTQQSPWDLLVASGQIQGTGGHVSAASDLMAANLPNPNTPVSSLDKSILNMLGYGQTRPSWLPVTDFETAGIGVASGRTVVDGYLENATIFADANANLQLDTGEETASTDANGNATIFDSSHTLVALGGVDTSTALPFQGALSAPSGYSVITPLTTLITLLQSQGVSAADQKVLASLGLSSTLDLSALDPIAAVKAGDLVNGAAEVAAAKVYSTVSLIGSLLAGAGGSIGQGLKDAFSAIASAVTGSRLNLTNATAVAGVISGAAQASSLPIPSSTADSVAAIIVAGNTALDEAAQTSANGDTLLGRVAAIELALEGAASNSIAQGAGNPSDIAAIKAAFTGANLDSLITQAQAHLANPSQDQAPTSFDSSATTNEDTPLNGVLVAADIDSSQLSFNLASQAAHGSVAIVGSGYTYTPAANFNGSDSFTFSANDGSLNGNVATVSIAVNPVNDPAIIGGALTGSVTEDKVLTAKGQLTISDVDVNESNFQPGTIKGNFGGLVLTADGKWTYTLDNANTQVQALNNGQSLHDVLQVHSLDGTGANVTITVNGVDDIVANVINGTSRGEKIKGTDGNDIITPFGGRDFVDAGKGDDVIRATIDDGPDFYNGSLGSDTVDYSALTRGITARLSNLPGVSGGIVIGRQSGTDLLTSIENIVGSQAGDIINGNNLSNTIEGSAGDDRLSGGVGSDTFVYKAGFGKDVITDFTAVGTSHDILQFSRDVFADWPALENAITDTSKGGVITTASGDSITLPGVTKAALVANHVADFQFYSPATAIPSATAGVNVSVISNAGARDASLLVNAIASSFVDTSATSSSTPTSDPTTTMTSQTPTLTHPAA